MCAIRSCRASSRSIPHVRQRVWKRLRTSAKLSQGLCRRRAEQEVPRRRVRIWRKTSSHGIPSERPARTSPSSSSERRSISARWASVSGTFGGTLLKRSQSSPMRSSCSPGVRRSTSTARCVMCGFCSRSPCPATGPCPTLRSVPRAAPPRPCGRRESLVRPPPWTRRTPHDSPAPAGYRRQGAERLVDGRGVGEGRGHVGLQEHDVGTLLEALIVLAAHGAAEVVLRPHVVVSDLLPAHRPRSLATVPSTPFGSCVPANWSSSRTSFFRRASWAFSSAVSFSWPGWP